MKSLLALPILVGGLLFSGCEATVVDRRPVVGHRYAYGDSGDYYRGHPDYYGGNGYSRPRSDYYERSNSVEYSSGYARARAPYHSGYTQEVVVNRTNVNRTNVNNTYVNRTNVTRKSAPNPNVVVPVSKKKRHGDDDKKRKGNDQG